MEGTCTRDMHGIGMDAPLETSEITDAFVQNKSAVGDLRSLKQQKNMESNGQMASGNCKQVPWYPLGSLLNLQNERNLRSGLDSNIFSELNRTEDAPDNLT